jgi:arylsulfatase
MKISLDRRDFLKAIGLGSAAFALPFVHLGCKKNQPPPNIIYILADDLGYGELGNYGQKKIKTPNIDSLASQGMKFTQHYSGSPVCAPSRCVLLTGKHTGHAYIRDNDEMPERGDVWHDPSLEGNRPLLPNTTTIGTLLQKKGYSTGAIGKWGLGGPANAGEPNQQGMAHNYYPTHLWKNGEKDLLEGNEYFFPHQKFPEDKDPLDEASYDDYKGQTYSMDAMVAEALTFIKKNKTSPFFHPTPRAAYAAMITRMDREIGKILALLEELGLAENTLVMFSSDNGPTFNGGTDSAFFESAGPLRGLKTMLYEGGIRVPMIARWPGKIQPGSETDHISAFWDVLPTITDIVGCDPQDNIDGISFLPSLLGHDKKQKKHEYLYWEYNGKQAVRMDNWKAYRPGFEESIELYNLEDDIGEQNDLAPKHPEIVAKIEEILQTARTESELFPLIKNKK